MPESIPFRLIRVLLGCAAAFIVDGQMAAAQDAVTTLPQSYKLEFQNEHVSVVRVRYEPHTKLPAHDHPKTAAAYVYLNDGGPVIFRHIGLAYGEIKRPATKARALRLAWPVEEVHEVDNPNDAPSEFLRVEFKQLSPEASKIRGRYLPEAYPPDEHFSKQLYENAALRVTRRACAPAKPCDLVPAAGAPTLLIMLTSGRFTVGGSEAAPMVAGHAEWLAAGAARVVSNVGSEPVEFLTFEFKHTAQPVTGTESATKGGLQ